MSLKKPVFQSKFDFSNLSRDFDPSKRRTQDSFASDCDINLIVKRFASGQLAPMSGSMPFYGDFSSAPDFDGAMAVITRATAQFESLSADIRQRFANNTSLFLEFMSNPKNHDEALKLGILHPKQETATESLKRSVSSLADSVSKLSVSKSEESTSSKK